MTPHRSAPPDGGNDWRAFETPTAAVTNAVATATNRSETELPPLYETVDSEALGTVLETGNPGTRFVFAYAGVRVTLVADGTIAIDT